jgi:hypothetical protein
MIKKLLVKIAAWLLNLAGSEAVVLPIRREVLASAKVITGNLDNAVGSGEYKRARALGALMNLHPEAKEGELALAIEVARL